jgi:RHS repeat-associated protein
MARITQCNEILTSSNALQIMAREDGSTGYWYQTDNLASVRDVFASSGSDTYVLDHVDYSAFGVITTETSASVGGRLKYTGEPWDVNTGLQYNNARYYSPGTGQWISQDQAGFVAGSSNLYEYVGNDPTDATDPSGREKGKSLSTTPQRRRNLLVLRIQ